MHEQVVLALATCPLPGACTKRVHVVLAAAVHPGCGRISWSRWLCSPLGEGPPFSSKKGGTETRETLMPARKYLLRSRGFNRHASNECDVRAGDGILWQRPLSPGQGCTCSQIQKNEGLT